MGIIKTQKIVVYEVKNKRFPERLKSKEGRLKFLRDLTGLTRGDIEKKHQIPEITIRKWENGRLNISSKGILRCLNAYEKEGVFTTLKWVEEGIGAVPSLGLPIQKEKHHDSIIRSFSELHPNLVVHKITENNMAPRYKQGEVVVGVIKNDKIAETNNTDCIINLNGEKQVVATIFTKGQQIFLSSINKVEDDMPLFVSIKSVNFIASIIWHRVIRL